MTLYKIKHKSSGWFYQPDRGSGNLSKYGKIYSKKPSLSYTRGVSTTLRCRVYKKELKYDDFYPSSQLKIDLFNIDIEKDRYSLWRDKYKINSKEEDWEIIEIEMQMGIDPYNEK